MGGISGEPDAVEDHPKFDLSYESPCFCLREHQFSIDKDIKYTTTAGCEHPAGDDVVVLGQYFLCQPDSLCDVVSLAAVDDLDFHPCPPWFPFRLSISNRGCQENFYSARDLLDHLC